MGTWQITSLSSLGDATVPGEKILEHACFTLSANGSASGFDGLNPWSGRWTEADAVVAQIRMVDVRTGTVGLAKNAPAAQLALQRVFTLIESGRPMTMSVSGNGATIYVGDIDMTARRVTGQ